MIMYIIWLYYAKNGKKKLKNESVYLSLEIDPIPKGRPKFTKQGRCYTPKKTKEFENELYFMAKDIYKGEPLEGALHIDISFYLRKPKTVKRKYPHVKPDLDNYIKGTLDALNGLLYLDDSQVVTITASKAYRSSGGIEIKLKKLK